MADYTLVKLNEKPIVTEVDSIDTVIAVVNGELKRVTNDVLRQYFEKLTGMRVQNDGTDYWIEYLNGTVWTKTGFQESL